ncbi:MAG: hypothetical protein NC548_06205 [Lachnospiraceae bacterium]|nr:hypothetical protein [Lachnospiraceae bacterium]
MEFMTKQDFLDAVGMKPSEMTIQILTHNDLDGYSSAMVVADWLLNLGVSRESISISHNDYDHAPSIDQLADAVFITDYSITNPAFAMSMTEALVELGGALIWIDHHQSSIDLCKQDKWKKLTHTRGIRDDSYCATYLVWQFLHPNEPIPEFIKLVDDFDCWKLKDPKSKILAKAFDFYPGFKRDEMGRPYRSLITYEGRGYLSELLSKGELYDKALPDILSGYIRQKGFIGSFKDGEFKDLEFPIINSPGLGSDSLAKYLDKYKIGCVFFWNGQSFTISFYSKNSGKINARKICEANGGGGHPDAAGFTTTSVPFKKVRDIEDLYA